MDVSAATVKVDDPAPGEAIVVGLNEALSPDGSPEAARDMSELNDPTTDVETAVFTEVPDISPNVVGDAAMLKPFTGGGGVGLKIRSITGCISIPLGATPVCPCKKSNIATPFICTGTLTCWKLELGVKAASNLARA